MRLAVLHPSADGSTAPFVAHDPECDPSIHLPEHEWEHFRIAKATAVRQTQRIAGLGFDVIVNLCDGAWEEDRPGIEVVQTLERAGVAFTGAGSNFYEPSRLAMKMAAHSAGVRIPGNTRFPLIVKHPNSYSSIGLTRASRVETAEELRQQIERMTAEFGAALVEEFVEGREFTVLVAEDRTYTPIEFIFPPGETFKHFDLKWRAHASMTAVPVEDPELDRRLRRDADLVFRALNGSSYARCDFRLQDDEPVFLEINPYCGVFYPPDDPGSADLILRHDPAGPRGFLEHLIACALRRKERDARRWRVEHGEQGFGLVAACAIAAGEIVERYEGRAQNLVSRAYARGFRGIEREWFERYAWPVGPEVFVTWSEDPEQWRPVNHSCDPSCELSGLDVVARRALVPGEAITLDYATFCGPEMRPFQCACGAKSCRGMIGGRDRLLL